MTELLNEICGKLGWHPTNGSCKGVWNRGKDAKPEGHQALWSCIWYISSSPGKQFRITPNDLVPVETMTPTQARAELEDCVYRDSQRPTHDQPPTGHPVRNEGIALLEKIEASEDDSWLRPVAKYLGTKRRPHYDDFGAPWSPPRGIMFMRPGWGAKGFTE